MPAGDIRGYDTRTGEKKWVFHTVPQEGEAGVETWLDESWRYSGNTRRLVDAELRRRDRLVYLPIATPTSDYYGGHRPWRQPLRREPRRARRTRPARSKWHFQAVHHGLWDYDFPCAPNLGLTCRARRLDRAKPSLRCQQAGLHLRLRPQSVGSRCGPSRKDRSRRATVPGEWTAPTQPFPTKPPPFDRQGVV